MSDNTVWDLIFNTAPHARNFDEDRPWLLHPGARGSDDDRTVRTMKFTSSLLLALAEIGGITAMRRWNLEDPADRERLWQHVREADQLLAALKVGLKEYDEQGED